MPDLPLLGVLQDEEMKDSKTMRIYSCATIIGLSMSLVGGCCNLFERAFPAEETGRAIAEFLVLHYVHIVVVHNHRYSFAPPERLAPREGSQSRESVVRAELVAWADRSSPICELAGDIAKRGWCGGKPLAQGEDVQADQHFFLVLPAGVEDQEAAREVQEIITRAGAVCVIGETAREGKVGQDPNER
jgi:hypothetical protein